MLKLIVTSALILAAVLSVTPHPIAYHVVQITWITQDETTWINVWDVTPPSAGTFILAQGVSSGVTNTLTLEATEGTVFQIQEYGLVESHLELVTFFNLDPVPHSNFPTPTQTSQPTLTPVPTNTPISNLLKVRVFIPIVLR